MTQQSHDWTYMQQKLSFERYTHLVFTAVLFTKARAWKQPEEWIEETCVYTTGCYSAVKGTQLGTYRAGDEPSRTRLK